MKKIIFTSVLLIISLFTFLSLTAVAQAALSVSITSPSQDSVTINTPVTFTVAVSGGSGIYTYLWDFGDGETAAGQSGDHTFSSAGSKTVNVLVTDSDSQQANASKVITVEEKIVPADLVAQITTPAADAIFNINSPVSFSVDVSGGSGIYTYLWDFGAGETAAGQSGAHTFTTAGIKTINVLVSDTGERQIADSVNITIKEVVLPGLPIIDFKVNGSHDDLTVAPGSQITLAWAATNATTCVATSLPASSGWSGTKNLTGSELITVSSASSTSQTFTLTCVGSGGSNSDTVTVTTSGGATNPALTVSNIRVTDITATSAIVRWTTNLPATSRVIYDTVSHSSIAGQATPNYGYQFSTAADESLTNEHAVTVSNLTTGTQYFFRVISTN